MAKKKDEKPTMEEAAEAERPTAEIFDPFVGGEDDDLLDMDYVQSEKTTRKVDTMPPDTKEDAELVSEFDDPTPVESDDKGDEAKAEDEETENAEEVSEEEAPAEEEPEVLAEQEQDESADEPQIPKHRFDEINDRNKKLEEELQALKSQVENLAKESTAEPEPEPEPYDYAAKEKEAMDAILEGDTDKYTTIRNEIRSQEKTDYLREAEKLAKQGDADVRDTVTFEETATQIERDFPQFAEDSEAYNAEARKDLLDLYVGYAAQGMNRADALQKAANRTVTLYGFNEPQPEPEPDDPKKVVNIKRGDPKKKAALSKKQPPNMEGSAETEDIPKHDFSMMSDEEFDALPESTKRRARGDIL